MRQWIRNHRKAVVTLAIGFVGVVAFVLVWFEPLQAFIDERVDEAFPVMPWRRRPLPRDDDVHGAVVLSDTQLASVAHEGSGQVLLIELPDGSRTVRFEDLDVGNGPDLFVVLSPPPLGTTATHTTAATS